MTNVRINVSSPTFGDMEIQIGSPVTMPFDDKFMQRQIASLLADAVKRVHRAYYITEEDHQ